MPLGESEGQLKPRVAVIGAGLAGLSAAWLLRKKYDVTLYERHPSAGMGVFTSNYQSNGINSRIDIPLRIFTPNYYPNLFSLYEFLGIEMEASDHSAVFQILTHDNKIKPFFQYKNATFFQFKLSYLARNSLNKTGIRLAYQQWRFFKTLHKDIKARNDLARITFDEYLADNDFDLCFIQDMLMPALAVTLTCDFKSVGQYPADLILDYLTCGVMQDGIMRATQGVDGIVPKLSQGYEIKCSHEVMNITSNNNKTILDIQELNTSNRIQQAFDHVIVASQADIAAKILASNQGDYNPQAQLLKRIPIETSTMVLHTDSDLLHSATTSVNTDSPVSYLVSRNETRAATTVDLTKAFTTYKKQAPVFQTWHPIKQPKKESIIAQAEFTRPLVTLESREIVKQLQELNKDSQVKICGSYMANRFPLLDAAVESSVTIARQMGASIPWEKPEKPRTI